MFVCSVKFNTCVWVCVGKKCVVHIGLCAHNTSCRGHYHENLLDLSGIEVDD